MFKNIKGGRNHHIRNKEVYKALFSEKNNLINSQTGFNMKNGNGSLKSINNHKNIAEIQNSPQIFLVHFNPDHPPNKIVIGRDISKNFKDSEK